MRYSRLGARQIVSTREHAQDNHPGFILKDTVLPALRLTVSQAARDLRVTRQTLHRLLAGQAAVSVEMAMKLERLCGINSMFWLAHQAQYDLRKFRANSARSIAKIPSHVLPRNIIERIGAGNG
jgi:antitoxin HigA-1